MLINLFTFIISFAIGLFFVYILGPDKRTVFVYPTPETVDNVLFQDATDNCFKYESNEVNCPKDDSLLSKIPIQI
jgi:hypothetical protein